MIRILCAGLLLLVARPAAANPAETQGLVLEVAGLGRSSDALRPTELEPHQVSTPGAFASIEVPVHESWALVFAATVGGSWQTFTGPGIQGRLSYVEWTLRGGFEHTLVLSHSSRMSAGIYSEYGEQNSWVKNLLVSREGPRGIHVGGGLRIGWEGGEWHRVHPCLAVERSVYRAHGTDDDTGNAFAWIGGSTALSLGLGVRLSR